MLLLNFWACKIIVSDPDVLLPSVCNYLQDTLFAKVPISLTGNCQGLSINGTETSAKSIPCRQMTVKHQDHLNDNFTLPKPSSLKLLTITMLAIKILAILCDKNTLAQ